MNKVVKEQIVSSAMDIMSKALKRLSDENKCDATDIQLVIKFNGERVLYSYMKHYEKMSDLTFNEILGVKFDFKQREFLTAPFLLYCLEMLDKSNASSPFFINSNNSKLINQHF